MLRYRELSSRESKWSWTFLALMLISAVPMMAQTTIHVPMGQGTIQAAIDAASNGDTVLVAPGTYRENVDFKGKAITVTSEGGAEVTTIDGGASGAVVTFSTSETAQSVISGFTLTNGVASAENGFYGGGIYIANASPTILNNTISHNIGCAAGIYVDGGAATIQRNAIVNNEGNCYGGRGAGISVTGATTGVQIVENVIANNTYVEGSGGGIALFYAGAVIVKANVISGNTTGFEGAGVHVFYGPDVQIINNLIVGNVSTDYPVGGGLYVYGMNNTSGLLLLGNTIAGNDAADGSGMYSDGPGGGMRAYDNLIIGKPGQSALYCQAPASNAPILQYNDIYSDGANAIAGDCGTPIGSDGNISVNPLFVGPDISNYHLQPASPVIDVGSNSFTGIPTLDLAGWQREYDANTGVNGAIDLGAFEYAGLTSSQVSTNATTFQKQKVGTTSDAVQVTVTNNGARTLDVSAISVTGDFAQTNTCRTSKGIAAGQSCTIDFMFTPVSYGVHSGTATIYSNVSDSPQTITLQGEANQPIPVLDRTSLTFGDQLINTTSAPQVVTLRNDGDTDLVVSGLTVTTSEFGVANTCTVVAPGESCSISVTFTPAGTRHRIGGIYIYDDAAGSPQTIALSGTGLGPEVTFTPTALDFGRQPTGSQSGPLALTITNSGSAALEISSVQVSGDYAQSNNCSGQIAPGNSCQAEITFMPAAVGSRPGTIGFHDNATGSPQTVALSGIGASPAIAALSETSVTLPGTTLVGQSSLPYSITYKNVGEQTLLISGMTTSSEFAQTNNCGTSLAPGASCSIAIVFNPTAVGTTMGSLQITDNAAGSPRSVTLAGTGMAYAAPTLTTVSPEVLKIGTAATLNVTGSNFYPASVVYWGEQALSTTFLSSTSLTASLPSALVNDYGEYNVTVRTPAPGGGTSSSKVVTTYASISITVRDIVYDPNRRLLYASTTTPNAILVIDPATRETSTFALGSDPNRLALSDDGQYLYIGLDSVGAVARMSLPSGNLDFQNVLTNEFGSLNFRAQDIRVLPGQPRSYVVSLAQGGGSYQPPPGTGVYDERDSPQSAGLVVYDDQTARSNRIGVGSYYPSVLVFMSDPGVLYASGMELNDDNLYRFTIDSSGITLSNLALHIGGSVLSTDGQYLYQTGSARIVNPTTLTVVNYRPQLEQFSALFEESGRNRVYMAGYVAGSTMLDVADLQHFTALGYMNLPISSDVSVKALLRWGENGIAIRGNTQEILLFRTSLTGSPVASSPLPAPALSSVSPSLIVKGKPSATITLTGTDFQPWSIVKWNGSNRTTTYVNATTLTALIPASDIAAVGTAQVTVFTSSPGGGTSGVQTVSIAEVRPTIDRITPTGGTGNATFTFAVSDESGYSNLNFVQGIINGSATYASGCAFMYLVGSNRFYLMNDAGSAWVGSAVAGTSTTLSNSQCSVDVSGISGSGFGNHLILDVPISFASAFQGQKSLYAYAANASANSGWQKMGTWTPNVPVVVPIATPPTVALGSYDQMTHLMNFAFDSVNGASYIDWVQGIINSTPTYASGCTFNYIHATNRLYLMNDAGTAWLAPVTLGAAATTSNSQCTIDAVKSWSQDAGNRFLLVLSVSAKPSVVGTQNIYGYAMDHGGLKSGWVFTGTWLPNPPLADTPPRVVSATSTPGIMSFTLASDNGGSYIGWAQVIVGSSYSYANSCTVYYQRAAKRLYLSNDAGTGWLGPVYLGQNTSVGNSQCTIFGNSSSETVTGNNLTVNVSATYATGFTGVRNAWGYVVDNVGKKSNWVNMGPFTVQ